MNIFHIDDDIHIVEIEQLSKCLIVYSFNPNHRQKLEEKIKIQPEYIITNDKTTYINNSFFKSYKIIHTTNPFQYLIKLIHSLAITKNFTYENRKNQGGLLKTHNRIREDHERFTDIQNYEIPKTLKELHHFLGLTNCYKIFIKNYAQIIEPLKIHLRDENGLVNVKRNNKIPFYLDLNALNAFKQIKIQLQKWVKSYQSDSINLLK